MKGSGGRLGVVAVGLLSCRMMFAQTGSGEDVGLPNAPMPQGTSAPGQEHFPTDILVGSAVTRLIGHYVVRSPHRRALRR